VKPVSPLLAAPKPREGGSAFQVFSFSPSLQPLAFSIQPF
jgi:hypothetical protein